MPLSSLASAAQLALTGPPVEVTRWPEGAGYRRCVIRGPVDSLKVGVGTADNHHMGQTPLEQVWTPEFHAGRVGA